MSHTESVCKIQDIWENGCDEYYMKIMRDDKWIVVGPLVLQKEAMYTTGDDPEHIAVYFERTEETKEES
jgi:hypothetical protein